MSRQQSAETRQRISQGMKYAHAQKRERAAEAARAAQEAADPVARRVKVMKESFTKGSGIADARVRNFGSIGPDAVRPSPSDVAANLVPETKGEQVSRTDALKERREGERYKPTQPEVPATQSQRRMLEAMTKRAEKKGE